MAKPTDDTKRARILEAALASFGEHGYGNTSVKTIADCAGIAAGSIYTYFHDKDELFLAALDDAWHQFLEQMDAIQGSARGIRQGIVAMIDVGLDVLKKVQPIVRGMYSEATRRDYWRSHFEELVDRLESYFVEAEREGSLRRHRSARARRFYMRIVISGVFAASSQIPMDRLDAELEEMKHLLLEAFIPELVYDEDGSERGVAEETAHE